MPFNASGFFQRLFNWQTDRDSGVKILAERMDQETDGIVSGINDMISGDVNWKGPLTGVLGTEAAPTYSFEDDPDTGVFRDSADTLAFSTGGTKRVGVDSSGVTVTGDFAASGDVEAVNVTASGDATVTGEVTAAKVTASDEVAAANVTTTGDITADGNVIATTIDASLSVIATNFISSATFFATTKIDTSGDLLVTGDSVLNTVDVNSLNVTNSTELSSAEMSGELNFNGSTPTIGLFDPLTRGAVIKNEGSRLYVQRANDTRDGTEQILGVWPLELQLDGDQNALFGGNIWSRTYGWLHDYFWRKSESVMQDVRLSAQLVSGYVNTFDSEFSWSLSAGNVLTGMHSVHNNTNEDRRFSFYYRTIQKNVNGIWYNVASL